MSKETYHLYEGVDISYIRIGSAHGRSVYDLYHTPASPRILKLCYCTRGACRLRFDNGQVAVHSPGQLLIANELAGGDPTISDLPFEAVELTIDLSRAGTLPPLVLSAIAGSPESLSLKFFREDEKGAAGSRSLTPLQKELAEAAEAALTADLSTHISIRSLAEDFHVSETSLKTYFSALYGCTISAYVRKKRLGLAISLLENTSLPMSEVAARTGYQSQSKFSAFFRRATGITPLAYRRRHIMHEKGKGD